MDKILRMEREAIRVRKMYEKIDADEIRMIQKREKKAIEKLEVTRLSNRNSKYTQMITYVFFFGMWQIICMYNNEVEWFNPTFLPSPINVIQTGIEYIQAEKLHEHIFSSLYRTIMGFALGTIVAISLGILTTSVQLLDDLVSPILKMIGPIPALAFLPMFIIWFGVGEESKIALIAYSTFMPLMTYTVDGIKNTNPLLIRSAKSLGANQMQVFTKVILKSALPNIFVGMKVSLGLTFSALVVAEMMGASTGLGFMITNARNWFKISDMFLAAALIGIEYSIFHGILSVIEKILFKWKKTGINSAIEH